MTKQRSKLSDTHECCQDIHEDDGIDPRRYFQASPSNERSQKSLQLCGQVAKILNVTLVGWDSPILASLFVINVVPAPTLSRMEVVVDTTQVPPCVTSGDIHAELDRAYRGLRVAVGEGITRKYVPDLTFRPAAPHEVLQ
jgi:hypothetical protein